MIPVDTRSAAEHRLARHTKIVWKACIVLCGGILAYFVLAYGGPK